MALQIKNRKFSRKRPPKTTQDLIHSLDKGKAFTLQELQTLWGMSLKTIRTHAKAMDCHRWMEAEKGQWEEVVLHPQTAKEVR